MARTSKKKAGLDAYRKTLLTSSQYLVGIYARLSVDNEEKKRESIDNQIALAREFASKHDDLKIVETYSDLGMTGTNFERKDFQRLMQDIRNGKINCVIVKDFSRFGRNYIETGNYIEKIFPFMEVRFISITDQFDSANFETGNEKLTLHLKNIVNELYARDIGIRVESAKKAKIRQGSFTGGTPSYGYEVHKDGQKRVLYPQAGTSEIVNEIYKSYDSGRTVSEIIRKLYQQKVLRPTEFQKYGHVHQEMGDELKQWSDTTLMTLLTNPIYIGTLMQRPKEGKEAITVADAHTPIVDAELFYRVSQKLENSKMVRNSFSKPKGDMPEDIFRGIIFCGECGKPLKRICHSKRQSYSHVFRAYSYGCPSIGKMDDRRCDNHYLAESVIRKIVFQTLRTEFSFSKTKMKAYIECNQSKAEEKKMAMRREEGRYQKALEEITLHISREYLAYREGRLSREEFVEIKKSKTLEKRNLQEALSRLQGNFSFVDVKMEQMNQFIRSLVRCKEDTAADGETIRFLIKRINVYAGRRVEIIFNFTNRELCG